MHTGLKVINGGIEITGMMSTISGYFENYIVS